MLYDQGAQEYAANQTREEARHVTAFAKYIKARWGRPVEPSRVLKDLLVEIIHAPEVYKKIIGMQMLVEGLAMGAFATFFQKLNDPLGRKLMQLVMTDEAFHHKFGKIWADRTVPKLDPAEHAIIEDWAAHCFQTLLINLVSPSEQRDLYEEFGLDPDKVLEEIQKLATDDARREDMKEATNIFRVLIKTLLNAGIITDRTRAFYGMYVDMDELKLEGDRMVGDDIAEEGIAFLKTINFRDRGPALKSRGRVASGSQACSHQGAPPGPGGAFAILDPAAWMLRGRDDDPRHRPPVRPRPPGRSSPPRRSPCVRFPSACTRGAGTRSPALPRARSGAAAFPPPTSRAATAANSR